MFVRLKRAPLVVVDDLAGMPGVAQVTHRVVMDVALDIPGLLEPATGRLISIPAREQPVLNEPFLRLRPAAGGGDEVMVSEGFALAHQFRPGDSVAATINGRRRQLRIVGIALSPEYIYSIRPGDIVPDNARFGIFWMERQALAAAFNMEGAFNDASFGLMRGRIGARSRWPRSIASSRRYGSLGAVARANQLSNWFIENELTQLQTMGFIIPAIFLGVSAFLLNIVLTRLIAVQREQIAALKALGYTNRRDRHALCGVGRRDRAGGRGARRARGHLARQRRSRPSTTISSASRRCGTCSRRRSSSRARPSACRCGRAGCHRRVCARGPPAAGRGDAAASLRRAIALTWLERALPAAARSAGGQDDSAESPAPARCAPAFRRSAWRSPSAILIVGMFSLDPIEVILDVQFNVAQRQDYTVAFVEPRSARAVHELAHLPGVLAVEPMRLCPRESGRGHRRRQTRLPGCSTGRRLQRVVDTSLSAVRFLPMGWCCRRSSPRFWASGPATRCEVELLEGARPVRTVVVSAPGR